MARRRKWLGRALLVATTAFGCSLFTSLDFVGHSVPDAGSRDPDAEAPDDLPEDGSVDSGDPLDDCAEQCPAGKVCTEGECVCPTNTLDCNGSCITSLELEDAGYCGTCGKTCRDDQDCAGGSCTCTHGRTDCGSECADLTNDARHCGNCDTACQPDELCIQGTCKASPCDGLCGNAEVLTASPGDGSEGYRKEPLGTGEGCFAVKGYEPTETLRRIVCWGFENPRTLTVNGVAVDCLQGEGHPLPPSQLGWYCIQVSRGEFAYAGILLPLK